MGAGFLIRLFWTAVIVLAIGLKPYQLSGGLPIFAYFPDLSLPLMALVGIMYGPGAGFRIAGMAGLVSQLVFSTYSSSFALAAYPACGLVAAMAAWIVDERAEDAYKALVFHIIAFFAWWLQPVIVVPLPVLLLWHGVGAMATMAAFYMSKHEFYFGDVKEQFLVYSASGMSALLMAGSVLSFIRQPAPSSGTIDLVFTYPTLITQYLLVGPILVGVLGVVVSRVLEQLRIDLGVVLKGA